MWSRRSILAGSSAAIIAGAAPHAAWGKTETDVIIIGAGLSGLIAATELQNAGMRAVVIEGSNRIGGRVHTLDDLPGRPEAGGIQVGAGYRILRDAADDLNIGLTISANEPRDALYRINAQTVAQADWASSAANLTVGPERALAPAALGGFYTRTLPPLASTTAWMDAANWSADIGYDQYLRSAGASDEARRLIAANLNGNSLAGLSQLHMMRTAAMFRSMPGPVSTINGGSQRIPEAMAKALKSQVRLRQTVVGIREDASGVTIVLAGGRSLRARQCICTIPFSVLRNMRIEGDFSPAIAAAIPALPYTRASFAYLTAAEPFWKNDGLPQTLWTDDPVLGRVFVLGEDPPMLKLWVSGPFADALDRMNPAAASAAIIAQYEAARPSAKGKLAVARLFSWQKQPFASGIYHHLPPGLVPTMAAAAQAQGKRLHFAGEHLAHAASGMEGALESGKRVGRAVAALG